jgi:enoyl-[acyl-carrier protein] reductase I
MVPQEPEVTAANQISLLRVAIRVELADGTGHGHRGGGRGSILQGHGREPRRPGCSRPLVENPPIPSPCLSPMLLDLRGKKALVTGIANNKSIAWGIAQQLHAAGCELGVTYLPDEKGRFEGKVRDLTAPLAPTLFEPLNVQEPAQIEAVFARVAEQWGSLDVLVHCLAFAGKEELIGDYSAISPEGFARALEVSAYSLAPLCRHAKPLFNAGASVITLSYLGAERAIPNYNVMGVAKAALEASVRYLAAELGPEKQVRVNAISAGPIRTLASSAIGGILDMIHNVEEKAPLRRTVTQEEVGSTAAFLASPLASGITGQVIYVDAGYCITGM